MTQPAREILSAARSFAGLLLLLVVTSLPLPAGAQTLGVYRELWTGLVTSQGNNLAALTNTTYNANWPNNPNSTKILTTFEAETQTGMNNYGQRARAFIVPPVTGAYTFWIASDDSSELFLSTDENPANKSHIAGVIAWTDSRQWTKEANQKSSPINLQAGRRYYLEAIMQQGGGGDNLAVRWQLPDGSYEEPINASSGTGTLLIPCRSVTNSPGIYTSPTNVTVAEHLDATFQLVATNNSPLSYLWLVNGATVPFATQPVLTVSNVSAAANNGKIYRCVVSNSSGSVTSAPVVLSVLVDTNSPVLDFAGNGSLTNITVHFTEPVETATATISTNYAVSGGITVLAATLTNPDWVNLTVSPMVLGNSYTLTVNHVRDRASNPNTIAPDSQISFTAQAYGLGRRPDIGPFLNDKMPEAAPALAGNWTAVVAFTNLMFTNALGLAAVPQSDRMIVWEREGRIWQFTNTPAANSKSLVLDISNQCQGWDDSGLLNVVFHPGFTTNHYIFVYYTYVTPGTVVGNPTTRPQTIKNGAYHDHLARFTLDANGVAVPGSEYVLVDQIGNNIWHNGSGMFFHPVNGFLYVTDGDDEDDANIQVINRNLFSGVWRIDVDMRGGNISHPIPKQPLNGTTAHYYIPNDNPFVGQAGVLEEFYGLGLRSPHRMTIDPPTGRIFLGDVGAGSREELDIIEPTDPPGLNFQWNRIEGLGGDLTTPYVGVNKRPVIDYGHSEGSAIIGGNVYRGSKFASDLGGRYIFGDNVAKKIWALDETVNPVAKVLLCVMPTGPGPNSGSDYTGLSSFGLDANNELYFTQMSSVGGHIYTLARSGPPPASRPMPPLLSETGAFKDTPNMTPEDGLIPYTVNSPLWSDAAAKKRWLAVPTNTFIHFTTTGEWTFPPGSVFVKDFELPVDDTNPNILRRLETRLIVRDTNGTVYGNSYKWRSDNSDADLVTNSITEDIVIQTGAGTRTQQWFYPGPLDCMRCHTPASGYVLGIKTRQLNGNMTYPESGVTDNQLRALNHAGIFDSALNEGNLPLYDHLVAVTNASASLTHRVRSYVDANCSQCHRPGGAPAVWDARFDTPLAAQGIINGTVGDSLGIPGAKVVAPLDISKSILYQRINTLDVLHRMPPLARNTIDTNAVVTLAAWINSLVLPTISPIPDIAVEANTSSQPLFFTVGDANTPADQLVVTGISSNPGILPNANIVFGGSGSNRTVVVTPALNQSGTVTVTVSVDNGNVSGGETFVVTVAGSLVAYYPFDGNAADSSGFGRNGTLGGGTSFAAGKVGSQALSFNGTSGYVQIPVSISNDFTIALWMKTTAAGGSGQWWAGKGIVDGEVNGSSTDFGTALVGANFALGIGATDTTIKSATAVNDGVWHHLAATRDNNSGAMAVYVDGQLEATGSGPLGTRAGPPTMRIGSIQTGSSAGFLAATVDDVRLYNYVLSAGQIAQLVNTPPNLAAITDRTIVAGTMLKITNIVSDTDVPAQTLTFSLVNPPAGSSIDPSTGIFTWRPPINAAGTTSLVGVKVTDNGSPAQSTTQSFLVTVTKPSRPGLNGGIAANGQFQLVISGDAGPDYVIQGSTNLVDWIPILITNSPGLPLHFTDPAATNFGWRFYRVQLGP